VNGAFQFGKDENFELLKGFLYFRGFSNYTEIWSDQPPLFTILLGGLFRIFGPSVSVARLMVLVFGAVLLVSFYGLVQRTSGRIASVVAILCLLFSPNFVAYSVSVMQEIPAFSIGLLAALLLLRWEDQRQDRLLFFSGLVMGCAMQIKLTAGLLLPAIATQMLLIETRAPDRGKAWTIFRSLSVWSSGACLSFCLILICCGKASANIHTMTITHFSHLYYSMARTVEETTFPSGLPSYVIQYSPDPSTVLGVLLSARSYPDGVAIRACNSTDARRISSTIRAFAI
jgi:4-amino-4-deoxy-L-arabinose transferase-like glycosyltransferase